MRQRKIILVLADGLGDRPSRRLGGLTPLQAASTPNLDTLAKSSSLGLLYPVAPGVTPGSDTAHLAIFGYDPYTYYKGRGPFEALGAGIDLLPGDVAFRGNFATVDKMMVVVDRRAGRSLKEARELIEYLNENIRVDGVSVLLKHGSEHRFALVLRGEGLSPEVTDTDPHTVGQSVALSQPRLPSESAAKTAAIVNEVTKQSHTLLEKHAANLERGMRGEPKANIILLRGAGSLTEIPSFSSKYSLKGFAVSGTAMIRGFCRLIGIHAPPIEGVTGDYNTNVEAKAHAAVKALDNNDFVYVHFKATDAAGHDGNPELKIRMVEKLDELIGEIVNNISGEEVLCVSGDHSTPVDLGEHSADPVPLLIHAPDCYVDGSRFTEQSCSHGVLGRLRGQELIPVLLNQANRIRKFGE
ncbi:MAG: 2,3-bisphosphoglycerate-independent phosphoglycerate mutase [Thermoprotei archaeon]